MKFRTRSLAAEVTVERRPSSATTRNMKPTGLSAGRGQGPVLSFITAAQGTYAAVEGLSMKLGMAESRPVRYSLPRCLDG